MTCLVPIMALALLAGAAAPPADSEAAPRQEAVPLANVNGHVITSADVDRQLRMAPPRGVSAADALLSPADRDSLERQRRGVALQQLIDVWILYDLALAEYAAELEQRKQIDKLVEEQEADFEKRAGSALRARQILRELGLTAEELAELQVRHGLADQFLRQKTRDHVTVSPREVRGYYDAHPEEFREPRTVRFRQILLVTADAVDAGALRAKAEGILAKVRDGMDFAEAADLYSADRGAYPGGLHTVRVPEGAADWLPPVVAGLAPGQVSELRDVPGGLAIGKLEQDTPAHVAPFDEVHTVLKASLLERKRSAAEAAYLRHVRREASVEHLPGARELSLN